MKVIKYGSNKIQGVMDPIRPTTITEAKVIIGMVHYYQKILYRGSHILDHIKEAASGPKGRKILCNYELETTFKDINKMASTETFLNYPDWNYFSPLTLMTLVNSLVLLSD